jgi:acyl-CoA thioester hydrolase
VASDIAYAGILNFIGVAMARIQIDLPESFVFRTELPVFIQHINARGHLDNAQVLALASEARLRFFLSLGYRGEDVEGLGIVVADTAVQYKSEAFHGEVLAFELAPAQFNRYGCDLMWRVTEAASGREVARGKNGIVFFDYAARRIAQAPEAFVRLFAGR